MENKKNICLVFKPYQEGVEMKLSFDEMRETIREGCFVDVVYNPCNIGKEYIAYIDDEGLLVGSPYCRGFNGTIIVVKDGVEGDVTDLTPKEIKEIKKKLDNYGNKFSFNTKNKTLKKLEQFFNEKKITNEIHTFSNEEGIVQLSNYEVIEFIGMQTDEKVIKNIYNTIVKLDFNNSPIEDYLYFLKKNIKFR